MKPAVALEIVERFSVEHVLKTLPALVYPERLATLEAVARARRDDVTLLLETFNDPHNYAAVLRSAEAFGLSAVHALPNESGAQFSIEVSKGAQKWIDFHVHRDLDVATDALVSQGYTLIGADAQGQSPESFVGLPKVCIVMGAERDGLSKAMRAKLSGLVAIEMTGFVESFNVSVAAALLTHRLLRAKPLPELDPNVREARARHWLARYLVQTVREPEMVLRR